MSAAERAYRRLPKSAGALAKRAWFAQARLTARRRALPDFVIIGAQRCGTTSLYEYLVADVSVRRALTKEVRYVDVNHHRGERWYRAHFPRERTLRRRRAAPILTGEASPDYVLYPEAPERLAAVAPDALLIAVLRDPVDRAYSHYWHQVRRGFESLSFEEAIAAEPSRCGEPEAVAGATAGPIDHARHHFAYLARGMYAVALGRWLERYPRDQLLVIESEHLFSEPMITLARVHAFLGLGPPVARAYPVHNQMGEGSMTPAMRRELRTFYESHDRSLEAILGAVPSWRSRGAARPKPPTWF